MPFYHFNFTLPHPNIINLNPMLITTKHILSSILSGIYATVLMLYAHVFIEKDVAFAVYALYCIDPLHKISNKGDFYICFTFFTGKI